MPADRLSRVALVGLLLILSTAALPAHAAEPSNGLCAAAAKSLKSSPLLAKAVAAAFGPVAHAAKADGDACTYPLRVLSYRDADVLLTQTGVPGEGCHGCEAHLSAYVFQRSPRGSSGLSLVKRFPDFASTGSHGAAAKISPLQIGADDGLAVEGGGTFQGYMVLGIDLFAFHAGGLTHLEAKPPITLAASNDGAMTDDSKVVSVTGMWSLDPISKAAIVVHYKVEARGGQRVETVVWALQGVRLLLTKGRLPPELKEAGEANRRDLRGLRFSSGVETAGTALINKTTPTVTSSDQQRRPKPLMRLL